MTSLADFVAAIFAKYDADSDGTLDINELKEPFGKLQAERADLGLTEEGYPAFYAKLDGDGDGKITPAELIAYLESINYVVAEWSWEVVWCPSLCIIHAMRPIS